MDSQPITYQRTTHYHTGDQHTGDQHRRSLVYLLFIVCLLLLLSGCGSIFGPAETAPTPTPSPAYALVPTFTPTSAAVDPTAEPTVEPIVVPTIVPTPTVALAITATLAAPAVTPAGEASVTIAGDAINIRSGPGTDYDVIGAGTLGQSFPLLARNAQGDWWQFCCINEQPGWIYGELATITGAEGLAIATAMPLPAQPTPAAIDIAAATTAPVAEAPTAVSTTAPAPLPPVDTNSSAGDFNPDAQYQIVNFRVLGLNENNGGIRDSQAQHHIFLTVLDQAGNGIDGAVVENIVGEKEQIITGNKGPGKAEVTMFYEPFKLRVATDGSGPVTSQTSNQMGLVFPHLPDIVGKLGDVNYEYGACPTIDIKCEWPIQAIHFSYEITFQKVK